MDSYALEFDPEALREWRALDASVRRIFKKALIRRLHSPVVESARLHGDLHGCFKIKSKNSGHRLVYTVVEQRRAIIVVAIGRRDRSDAYRSAGTRLPNR